MSKARLVITAVLIEKRPVSEVARSYGVARSWIYTLLARYRDEGEAAFEPRSRRPRSCPSAINPETAEAIVRLRKELAGQGLDAGPDTIAWHLERYHLVQVSPATVSRYLARAGLVVPAPAKRPRSSYVRFAAEQPNECWQSGFTHYPLADGTGTEILTWLDDHSRLALSLTACYAVTGEAALAAFRAACARYGPPAATLTDNGTVFTTRLLGRGGAAAPGQLELELLRLGITRKNGRPGHPQTQGKVERFQQTLKKWLTAQPAQPGDLTALQDLLDDFAVLYNTRRPHRSLNRATPAAVYAARPKAAPASPAPGRSSHIRPGRVEPNGTVSIHTAGRPHHIGIGRAHAGTPVLIRTAGPDITIIHATTGEILRQLTLDPARNYQPTGAPKGRTPRHPK